MNGINKIVEVLKTQLDTDSEGQLYKSLPEGSLACGSVIYDNVLVHTITVDHIRSSGLIILGAHYPSKSTGRWETSSVFCMGADVAISTINSCIGKRAADLPSGIVS